MMKDKIIKAVASADEMIRHQSGDRDVILSDSYVESLNEVVHMSNQWTIENERLEDYTFHALMSVPVVLMKSMHRELERDRPNADEINGIWNVMMSWLVATYIMGSDGETVTEMEVNEYRGRKTDLDIFKELFEEFGEGR